MRSVIVYTDGSSAGRPDCPGGYAAIVLEHGKEEIVVSGYAAETTNNRMEMTAAIEGIKAARGADSITVYSDSQYLVNGFKRGWINKWRKNNWRKSVYKGSGWEPVKNKDLWKHLDILCRGKLYTVEWVWVKAHAGNEYNERCDMLAKEAASKVAR